MPHAPTVRIDVFTIFPELVGHFFEGSLLGKANRSGAVDLRVHDLRAETTDARRTMGPGAGRRSPCHRSRSGVPDLKGLRRRGFRGGAEETQVTGNTVEGGLQDPAAERDVEGGVQHPEGEEVVGPGEDPEELALGRKRRCGTAGSDGGCR